MTSIERMGGHHQSLESLLSYYPNSKHKVLMADQNLPPLNSISDESLVSCNLPPRNSVSEMEPSRHSYYNGDELLSVPFKWEVAPGKALVDENSQPGSPDYPAIMVLKPPPSASNSPLNPLAPLSYKERQASGLPPKARTYSRPEFTLPMSTSSTRSNSTVGTTVESKESYHNERSLGHHRSLTRSNLGSVSKRSEFDWPEVSDDESTATEPQLSVSSGPRKNWSFSSSSLSSGSLSQSPSPVNSGAARGGGAGGSTKDILMLRNMANYASSATPATCYVGGRSSDDGSVEGEEESDDEGNDVHPGRGFFSCMPIFSKVRMVQSQMQSQFGSGGPSGLNLRNGLTPGMKNKAYRSHSLQGPAAPKTRVHRTISL